MRLIIFGWYLKAGNSFIKCSNELKSTAWVQKVNICILVHIDIPTHMRMHTFLALTG
jgi:hypothetical protein